MIQPNELRIGNWILFSEDSTPFRVLEIDGEGFRVENKNEVTWIEKEQFSPIPLNPELLEKCGFVKYSNSFWFWESSIFSIEKETKWWQVFYASNDRLVRINHLHHLQNLYYSLTNQELNIQL